MSYSSVRRSYGRRSQRFALWPRSRTTRGLVEVVDTGPEIRCGRVGKTADSSTPAELTPASWRIAVVRLVSRLPAPLRRAIWRSRRAAARASRRRREARGDFSRSRPALHGIDRTIERYLGPGRGFFVEAGANDGFQQSNTYALERIHGWNGVLVEPVPELAREAARERAARVFNCALWRAGSPTTRYAPLRRPHDRRRGCA